MNRFLHLIANICGIEHVTAYFVTGLMMETMSTSCTPSWRMPEGLAAGIEHTVGPLHLTRRRRASEWNRAKRRLRPLQRSCRRVRS